MVGGQRIGAALLVSPRKGAALDGHAPTDGSRIRMWWANGSELCWMVVGQRTGAVLDGGGSNRQELH